MIEQLRLLWRGRRLLFHACFLGALFSAGLVLLFRCATKPTRN